MSRKRKKAKKEQSSAQLDEERKYGHSESDATTRAFALNFL